MQKTKRPWWQYVLGCGCISILLGIAVFAGGTYWVVKQVQKSIFMDSGKVDALAAVIFPGAKPIAGTDGFMGMDMFGMRMAVIAPPGGKGTQNKNSLQFVLFEYPEKMSTKDEARNQMASSASSSTTTSAGGVQTTTTTNNNKEKILKSEPVTLTVGGKPFPADKELVEDAKKEQTTRYLVCFKKAKGSAFIWVQGDPKEFNEAGMNEFLAGVSADGLEPLPGAAVAAHAASPSPSAVSPAPSKSPVAESTP